METELSNVYVQMSIAKSQNSETDSDGNYIFEVEASNENLDLQNQIVQQKALLGSKEYFLTNGVISDDHQHKTRDENGEVEKNLDKVIGEPISVWTDGTKTFVKGKLYANNKYAKGYINLLKANSSRVHASVGGIMPKIRKNADGTETVTNFMWNDLALTTSPVNWTVGSAKFAKSLSSLDFCKALSAGYGTDSATFTDGRALQEEDTEKRSVKVDPDRPNDIEKKQDSLDEIVRECVIRIDTGELEGKKEIQDYLKSKGLNEEDSQEILRELIKQGDEKMSKSNFFSAMADFAKSLGKKDCNKSECKKGDMEEDEKDLNEDEVDEEFDFEEDSEDTSDDKDDKDVKKSYEDEEEFDFEEDSEMVDATELFKSMSDKISELKEMNNDLRRELKDTQESMIDVTKSLADYLSTPNQRKSVVQKSLDSKSETNGYVKVKPDNEDFKTFKNAIAKAISEKELDPYKVTMLSGTFQKSMKGEKILKSDWNSICAIVNKFGK